MECIRTEPIHVFNIISRFIRAILINLDITFGATILLSV